MNQLLSTLWDLAQNGPVPIFLIMVALIAIVCALRNKEIILSTYGCLLILFGITLPLSFTRDLLISWFPHATVAVPRLLIMAQDTQLDTLLIITGVLAFLRGLRKREGYLILSGLGLIGWGISLSVHIGLSKTLLTIIKDAPSLFHLGDLVHNAPLPAFLIAAGFTAIIWALRNKTGTLITVAVLLIIITTVGVARF